MQILDTEEGKDPMTTLNWIFTAITIFGLLPLGIALLGAAWIIRRTPQTHSGSDFDRSVPERKRGSN